LSELLQTLKRDGPELAARAFINPAFAQFRSWHDLELVPVEFGDKSLVKMPGEDFSLGRDSYGNAGRFRQAIGHLIDAPVGAFLAPAWAA
jgi:hypothetical protein